MLCAHPKLKVVRRLPCYGHVPQVTPDSSWRGRFGGRRDRDRVQVTVMAVKVEMKMKHQPLCCERSSAVGQDFPWLAKAYFMLWSWTPPAKGWC